MGLSKETQKTEYKHMTLRLSPRLDNDLIFWKSMMEKRGESIASYCKLAVKAKMENVHISSAIIPFDYTQIAVETNPNIRIKFPKPFYENLVTKFEELRNAVETSIYLVDYVKQAIRDTIEISDNEECSIILSSEYANELARVTLKTNVRQIQRPKTIAVQVRTDSKTIENTEKAETLNRPENTVATSTHTKQEHVASNSSKKSNTINAGSEEKSRKLLDSLINQTSCTY